MSRFVTQPARRLRSLVSHAAMAVAALFAVACKHDVTCNDLLFETAASAVPRGWSTIGIAPGAQATACDVPSDTSLHLVEPTSDTPEERATNLVRTLEAKGWLGDGSPTKEAEGDVVVKMRRDGQVLVFDVHPISSMRLGRPALGIHFALSAAPPAPPIESTPFPNATSSTPGLPTTDSPTSSAPGPAQAPSTSLRPTSSASATPPSACNGLDYCACKSNAACQVKADGCICACDYGCPAGCKCVCGGGKYLGCAAK